MQIEEIFAIISALMLLVVIFMMMIIIYIKKQDTIPNELTISKPQNYGSCDSKDEV